MSDSNTDINAELFNAVKNGEIDKVKSLISDGADVNASDGWFIPLYWAAKNHHFNIVEVLLDNGAEFIIPVSHAGRERHVQDRYQKIETEHCKNSLHLAARLGKLEEVKNLLRKGAEIDAKNDKGQTPFDLAVDEEIKDLLQSVKEANDKLLEAAKSGNIGDIENLLNEEGKAQVNATDQDGWTPLHWAAESGRKEIVVALINAEAKVDAQGEHEETSLHLAAENGHKDVVEFLLKVEEINVNATDQDGWTPLHWAALYGKEKVVEFLLKVEEINVNATDQDGKTPLDLTTNDEIIALLNKAAEDPDAGSVDEPSTDSKEDQEEDAGTEKKEKQEGNAQPGSDITNQEADETVSSGSGTPQTQQGTISAGEGTQTEEHSSSLFGSLFSILMKPFSLIASFFGGFFHGCLGLTKKKLMNRSHSLMMMFLYLHRVHWTIVVTIQ